MKIEVTTGNEFFYLFFPDMTLLSEGEIFKDSQGSKFKVIRNPRRKWYKVFFQWLTFGWYKAPRRVMLISYRPGLIEQIEEANYLDYELCTKEFIERFKRD